MVFRLSFCGFEFLFDIYIYHYVYFQKTNKAQGKTTHTFEDMMNFVVELETSQRNPHHTSNDEVTTIHVNDSDASLSNSQSSSLSTALRGNNTEDKAKQDLFVSLFPVCHLQTRLQQNRMI